jgi:HEAT repeat protein
MRVPGFAAWLGAAVALSWARPAGAQKVTEGGAAGGASTASAPVAQPTDWSRRLASGDNRQIKTALDDLRLEGRGGAVAIPAIVDLLRRGLPPALTKAAIETLGDTESDTASDTIAWYTRHRNAVVRRAAVEALAKTRGPGAAKTLEAALSDSDETVRGLAATGLGTMRVRDAVAPLFTALDHKVFEASSSIGAVCAGADCERLAGKLGSLPFNVVTGGLNEVLIRPPAEVSDDLKLKIVGRVRELGTGEANQFLQGIQAAWPKAGSRRVKRAIDQAVLATTGSPGAGGPGTAP